MSSLIIANWKMNTARDQAIHLAQAALHYNTTHKIVLSPSFVHIEAVHRVAPHIALAAQDCAASNKGAHTGETAAFMLKEIGCTYVLIGHSERRLAGETDIMCAQKVQRALESGLIPVLCVGETLAQKQNNQTKEVLENQLEIVLAQQPARLVIAYEPVWAIGSGLAAEPADVEVVHLNIYKTVQKKVPSLASGLQILYGGSVKPQNAAHFLEMPHVNGLLVGGASLDAEQFKLICEN